MNPARIPELDGLRGIAATGVALYHIHPQGTFWMWSFVDLFFVLSGFLITGILLRLQRWDATSLRNFWMRRIIRIWPVYYLTLLGVLALWFVWQWAHGQALGRFSGFWESLVFLQYWVGDYATLPPGVNYLWWFGHSWSLAVEEQFYLLWPPLLWLLWQRPIASIVVLLGLVLAMAGLRWLGNLPEFVLPTRGDGLVLGSLVALLMSHAAAGRLPVLPRWAACVLWTGAFIVAGAAVVPYLWEGYAHRGGMHWEGEGRPILAFAALYALLVAGIVRGSAGRLAAWLRAAPLVYLGTVSYAMYMFHVPIQKGLNRLYLADAIEHRWLVELLFWTMLLTAAELSRRYLERPAESLKARFPLALAASARGAG